LSDQKQEKWITWLALTTAAMAVFRSNNNLICREIFSQSYSFPGAGNEPMGVLSGKEHQGVSL
jgi:hypothetical protein